MIGLLRRLRAAGVLGINRRNRDCVFAYNPRQRLVLVNDKLLAKDILRGAGVPTPETLAVARRPREIGAFLERLSTVDAFAVKPCSGSGGSGLLLARRSEDGSWRALDGRERPPEDIAFHIAGIIEGMYSGDGERDAAIAEPLLVDCEELAPVHGRSGIADLRIIVLRGVPVMAMLRLPCRESDGAANLHAGGVGVGIDLADGRGTFGVRFGRPVEQHPDTGWDLRTLRVPHWREVLDMSRGINGLFGLGYLGIDVVFDAARGPLVLEVNGRPGLDIQIANRQGLLRPLRQVG